jgi:hypothetical protein
MRRTGGAVGRRRGHGGTVEWGGRLGGEVSYPGSKKHRTEASIRVPKMFNHTHSNNMINR